MFLLPHVQVLNMEFLTTEILYLKENLPKTKWYCKNSSNITGNINLYCVDHDGGLSLLSFRSSDILSNKKKKKGKVDLRQPRYTLLRAIVPFALANKGKLWSELLDRE